VQQLNPLKVAINVQVAYFPLGKAKMPAAITVESYAGETFEGKVNLVYPTIDPTTHTFTTEITVTNNQLRIRPGMFARVLFNFGTIEHVVVPDKAIVKQTGTNDRYVFVLNSDNTVSYKKVELGQRMGGYYEVLSGVNDGEQVVTAGLGRLIDGTTVTVIKE
jgi:RND family efflux transporter MFP subunit